MKRITAIFLIIVLALGLISGIAAAESEATDNSGNKITEILSLTGITEEGFTPSEAPVTRGELAAYAVRAKGFADYLGTNPENTFFDVDNQTKYYREIAIAKEMKLLSGYSDGSFCPDNNTTILQAAVCFIRVLGYGAKAEGIGGYPAGYYSVIRETGLLKNISKGYTETLTTKDAVTLIYNALHTKVMEATSFGNGDSSYEVKPGRTLLYSAFGISYVDDVVNGVDITNLFGENNLSPYHVLIGNNIYYSGVYNMEDLLGFYVRAYYKEEDGKNKIKLAVKLENKNTVETVDISEITYISGGKLETTDINGKVKSYSYNETASVIYNGTNTTHKFNTDIYKDENGKNLTGTVKLLDNNNDNKADVIFIKAFSDVVTGRVDKDKGIVYDYYNYKRTFKLDTDNNEPFVQIFNEEGESISLRDLSEGLSLSIYASKNDAYQKYINVFVSSETVSGKISYTEERDGKSVIALAGGEEYILSDYALLNISNIIAGRSVDLLLNHRGEIAEIKYSVAPGDYTFAMLAGAKKQQGFEGDYIIKLMAEDGSLFNLKLAENVKVDGNDIKSSSAAHITKLENILRNASVKCGNENPTDNYFYQIIKYGINKEGDINYIDTVLDKNGDPMAASDSGLNNEIYSEKISGTYLGSTGAVAQKVILASDLKVYMYPAPGDEGDNSYYTVRGKEFFKDSTRYNNLVYVKDTAKGYVSSVFLNRYTKSDIGENLSGMTVASVADITRLVNKEGTPCVKLYIYENTIKGEIIVPADLSTDLQEVAPDGSVKEVTLTAKDIKKGDLIYYTKDDVSGEVNAFVVFYSHLNNKLYGTKGSNKCELASVIDATAEGIKLVLDDNLNPDIESALEVGNYTIFNNIQRDFFKIDIRTGKMEKASHYDLDSYVNSPTDYSRIVLRMFVSANSPLRDMFIYK